MRVFYNSDEINPFVGNNHEFFVDTVLGAIWIESYNLYYDIYHKGTVTMRHVFNLDNDFEIVTSNNKLISFDGYLEMGKVQAGQFERMDLLPGRQNQLYFEPDDRNLEFILLDPRIIFDSDKRILRITADPSIYGDFFQLSEDSFVEIYSGELVGAVFKTPNLDFGIDLKDVSMSQEGQAGSGTSR